MQKILIDISPLDKGHAVRGVGFYIKNLINNIEKLNTEYKIDFKSDISKIKLDSYNLIFYPYFDLFRFSLPFFKKAKKQVVMIHDVIPLLYPQYYPAGIKGRIKFQINKYFLNKNYDVVITNSETSKKDIVRFLDFNSNKIFVTHLAPSFNFNKVKENNKLQLPERFVLYVGDVNWNKDILTLVRACIKIKKHLIIVGKQAVVEDFDKKHIENKPLKILQEKYGNNKYVHRLGYLSNEDLNYVWNKATVYCQPSLYEGFGMPLVEAFQAEVPVIASKTQALVEIGGDACEYFETSNVNDLSEKINKIFTDNELKEELVKKAKQKMIQYNWEKTSTETLKVFSNLLK